MERSAGTNENGVLEGFWFRALWSWGLIDPFQPGRYSLKACCYISHHDFSHLTFGRTALYNTAAAREVWGGVGWGVGSPANWKVSDLIRDLLHVSCGV